MDNPQQGGAGFSQHVANQINQIAASSGSHRNGNSGRRGGRAQHNYQWGSHQTALPPQNFSQHSSQRSWHNGSTGNPPDMNSYPPLGAQAPPREQSYEQTHARRQPGQIPNSTQQPQQSLQTTPQRVSSDRYQTGGHRGGYGGGGGPTHSPNPRVHQHQANPNDFRRPQSVQGRLYNAGINLPTSTPEQQRAFRYRIMSQSDFLGSLASQALKNQITQEEYHAKETFRKIIQTMAQNALKNESQDLLQFNVENVKLKLYGSLGSGFGVAGSDMDLLLTFPQNEGPLNGIEIESRRWLEKSLLDAGYGARLLTNTRVPILKVCEKPSPELLQNLRDYRKQWEDNLDEVQDETSIIDKAQPPPSASLQPHDVTDALEKVLLVAAQVPLPRSPTQETLKLDFVGECGIQCDVNFTNYVALRNTELLRTYGGCDPRVRQVGLFIKHWAKARDINTPYKGTLSSYGYIMMVLHYLMNIVNPPLIPNLQALARERDEWDQRSDIERVEGFDVRFIRDPQQLRNIMSAMVPNRESLGSLLRGFFWYYGCHGGFHWIHDVISIRTRGGQLTKQSKGWIKAGNQQAVRLRYLLAIEDPFEVEHNIGRTVGHNGIVAIRDEFRRAWSIIEGIQYDDLSRTWFSSDATERKPGDHFMEVVENRGDLLRKDQEAHREKLRQLRQATEAKEQALKDTNEGKEELTEQTATSGTCKGSHMENSSQSSARLSSEPRSTKLIDTRSFQDQERIWRTPYSRRQVLQESEASDEEMEADSVVTSTNENSTDDPLSQNRSMWLDLSEPDHQTKSSNETTNSTEAKQDFSTSWGSVANTKNFDWGRKDFSEGETPVEGWGSETTNSAEAKQAWGSVAKNMKNIEWGRQDFSEIGTPVEGWESETTDSAEVKQDSSTSWGRLAKNTKNFDWGRKDYTETNPTAESWDNSAQDVDGQWYGDSHVKQTKSKVENKSQSVPEIQQTRQKFENKARSAPQVRKPVNDKNDVIEQRRSQFDVLGDAVFARSSNAQTRLEPHSRGPRADKKVGRLIFWDQQTEGGKWLRWRDNLITSGHWMPPRSDVYVNLDARYPFNPEMSYADLHEKNEELRRFYSSSLLPEDSLKHNGLENEELESIISVHQRDTQGTALSQNTISRTAQILPSQIMSTPIEEAASDASPAVHSLPSQMTDTTTSATSSAQDNGPQDLDIQDLRALRIKHFSQMFARDDRESKGKPATQTRMGKACLAVDKPTLPVAPQSTPVTGDLATESIRNHRVETANTQPENDTTTEFSRQPGLHLDPRQLQDLEIIQQGGNGCARQGEQFNIEEDYELGGGGAMGYKSSSGIPIGPLPPSNAVSTSGEGNRELLRELPRSVV